jgi:hypothetical protein
MPHPADHPAAALAITRGLSNQLQKAKAAGDHATVAALEAALARARQMVARAAAQSPPRPPQPTPQAEEGWAEIVSDRRQRPQRWR